MRLNDRRKPSKYTERLSSSLLWIAGVGCAWVLLDPVVILPLSDGAVIKLGASGFSNDLKGAVIATVIVGSFVALHKYWLDRNDDREVTETEIPETKEQA